jgi:hypothetical protein
MSFAARDLATLDVPTEPLALRARRHAWAAVVARLPSTPRADNPLVIAWEAHREAWGALPADVRTAVDDEFRRRHRCPGLTTCRSAERVA